MYDRFHFDHGNNLHVRFYSQIEPLILNLETNPELEPYASFVVGWQKLLPAQKTSEARLLCHPMYVLSDVLSRADIVPANVADEIYEENKGALSHLIKTPPGCPDKLVTINGCLAVLKALASDKRNKRPRSSWLKAMEFMSSLQALDSRYATLVPTVVNLLNDLCEIAATPKTVEPINNPVTPEPWFSSSLAATDAEPTVT